MLAVTATGALAAKEKKASKAKATATAKIIKPVASHVEAVSEDALEEEIVVAVPVVTATGAKAAKEKKAAKAEAKTTATLKVIECGITAATPPAAEDASCMLLGCSKCRGSHGGCSQCRSPGFHGKRWQK